MKLSRSLHLCQSKKTGTYLIRFLAENGKWRSSSLRTKDKAEALRIINERNMVGMADAARERVLTTTMIDRALSGGSKSTPELASAYFAWASTHLSPSSIEVYRGAVLAFIKEARVASLHAVTSEDVSRWLNNPDSPKKVQTRKVHRTALLSFFEWAFNERHVTRNPVKNVVVQHRGLGFHRIESTARYALNEAEVSEIVGHMNAERAVTEMRLMTELPQVRGPLRRERCEVAMKDKLSRDTEAAAAVCLAWGSGLRINDALAVTCEQITDDYLIVWTAKARRRTAIPLSYHAVEQHANPDAVRRMAYWIRESIAILRAGNMMPCTPQAKLFPTVAEATVSARFHRAAKAAGIQPGPLQLCLHSLRHGRVKELAAHGMSLDQIAVLVAHGSTETTKHYAQ
jgi:integrase